MTELTESEPSLINYDTNYKCKYKNLIEIDKYKNADCDVETELYRLDLLHIFKLDSYDDDIISNTIGLIYDQLIENKISATSNTYKNVKLFNTCLKNAAKTFHTEDAKIGFLISLSFDYLDLTHNVLCELIVNGDIEDDTIDKIKKSIMN